MNDTPPEFEAMVNEHYRRMTPDERVRIAASMYDTARAIVLSSLPSGLSRRERRLALARRFYGGELPEDALIAYAEWSEAVDAHFECSDKVDVTPSRSGGLTRVERVGMG